MPAKDSSGPDLALEVGALLGFSDGQSPQSVPLNALGALTQRQLLAAAKALGISGASKKKKGDLAHDVWTAWQALVPADVSPHAEVTTQPSVATDTAGDADGGGATTPPRSHKFEVGEAARASSEQSRQMLRDSAKEIPWGYGRDRITAMPVDPERLFAYWEVLDDSIARARTQLGKGGPGAWLNLRLYDTTDRIFDGTNAHSTADHRVERGDRQWFLPIGRPTSDLIVEIGLKSDEGFFVKLARSGRVTFPRRDPAPWTDPEWLTVRMAAGQVERTGSGMPPRPARPVGALPAGGVAPRVDGVAGHLQRIQWDDAVRAGGGTVEGHQWEEVHADGTMELHGRFRWEGPAAVTSWEAGPFPYPVEVPEPVRDAFAGKTRTFRLGARTHVVYGPWQVIIRGIGAQQSRTVLSRWEVYRSWAQVTGHEVEEFGSTFLGGGGSEGRMGSSERHWTGSSELRLGGSSEQYFLSASELRLGGASELMGAGASEYRFAGASERRFLGGTEAVARGSSEQLFVGSSGQRPAVGFPQAAATAPPPASSTAKFPAPLVAPPPPQLRTITSAYPPPPVSPKGS
jgi:hypothetical protein